MRKLILYSILSTVILAKPNSYDWKLKERLDNDARRQLGSCDASGLPSSAIQSLGLDSSSEYRLDDNLIDDFLSGCKNYKKDNAEVENIKAQIQVDTSNYTLKEVRKQVYWTGQVASVDPLLTKFFEKLFDNMTILMMKYLHSVGLTGFLHCNQAISDIYLCKDPGSCPSGYIHYDSLAEMPQDNWEKTLEYVIEARELFAKLKEAEGSLVLNWSLAGVENKLVEEILELSMRESLKWFKHCMMDFVKKAQPLLEKHCPHYDKTAMDKLILTLTK